MADITLRDYLAKLDDLLNKGASSEVIHHCRHILQYFPKNADTYRYLGRALVDTKSWREAGEVLRRVLSVYPDEFYAHAGLSEVYLNERRADDAIWHLERAFEQQPNNQMILDALRELYRKHRRVEQVKVHLTTGAVARQYIRNGLYTQAVETLQQAIERTPERIDLKLFLAQTYWDAGQIIEAAETAVEVLKTLPDCLEANRILASLWLREARPSDAQRYISRIQSVSPYAALELAQGQAVADDAFKLDELDYRRAAEREIITRSPDWLQAIDQNAEAGSTATNDDTSDWMGSLRARGSSEAEELPDFSDENFSSELPQDWFSETVEKADEPPSPAQPRVRTGLTGLLSALDGPEPESVPAPGAPAPLEAQPSLDDLFASQVPTEADFPTSDDLFSDDDPTPQPVTRQTGTLRDNDPLAWLKESGVEIADPSESPVDEDLFGAEADNLALQEADAADPLAWLKTSGGDEDILTAVPASQAVDLLADDKTGPLPSDDEDPLAWLKGEEIEPARQADARTPVPSPASEESDSLDWLADESLLDEALNLEALVDSPQAAMRSAPAESQDDPEFNMEAVSDDASGEVGEQPATGMADVSAAEMPEQQAVMPQDQGSEMDWTRLETPKPVTTEFTWANDASSGEAVPDLFGDLEASGDSNPPDDDLSWMTTLEDTGDLPTTGDEQDASGWVSQGEAGSAAGTVPADASDWAASQGEEDAGQSAAEPAALAETPAARWITEALAAPPAQNIPADSEWTNTMNTPDSDTGDVPDWLAQVGSEEVQPTPQASGDASDDLDWMSAVADEAPAATDVPDWLSEMNSGESAAPEPVMAEAAPTDDAGFEWMSEVSDGVAEEAPVVGETPDWLAEMKVEEPVAPEPVIAEAAPTDEVGFEWMSEVSDAVAEEAPVVGEAPDWLAEMKVEEPAAPEPVMAEAAPTDEVGFEWMSEVSDAVAEEAPVVGEAPDWLAEMKVEDPAPPEPAAVMESSVTDETELDWMSEAVSEDVPVEQAAPDWLAEVQPEVAPARVAQTRTLDDGDAEQSSAPSPAPEFDWGEKPSEAIPVGEGQPEWLSELQSNELPPAAEAEALQPRGEVPDWLAELQQGQPAAAPAQDMPAPEAEHWGDEAQPVMAEETPDWLQAMQPAELDSSLPAALADEPVKSEFEWMDDVNAQAGSSTDTMDVSNDFDDQDFASADTTFDGEPEPAAPAPAGNAPDWLNAMVPGLDVDYDAPEDAPIEQEYLPGSENRVVPIFQSGSQPARSREFGWLSDIVEEETQQMKAVEGKPRRGRFSFSRLPVWLRAPTEKSDQAAAVTANDDDWSDVDLPPWLQ